jgi:virginiamycin B lyase
VWFTELVGTSASSSAAPRLGRITPRGVVTEFELPGKGSGGLDITAGADGIPWFTEAVGGKPANRVGRITPQGHVTEYPLPRA